MKSRILSLVISMMLVFGCITALSSCALARGVLDALIPDGAGGIFGSGESGDGEEEKEEEGGEKDDSENSNIGDGTTDGDIDGGDDGLGSGAGEEDEKIEFIPGSADGALDADGLTSAQRALLSTVIVRPVFDVNSGYTSREEIVNGSGVIYSIDREAGDAIIITNYHVVFYKEALTDDRISDEINVYLYGMESEQYKITAEFIGGALTEDIAVLKVSGSEVIKNSCAVSAIIGDSAALSVTDKVLAVGNPEGDGISASEGIVSVSSETIDMTGADGRTTISLRVIRVDAGVNQGNSGGALYDASGRLVGIVNAKKTGSEIDNIAWALPINRVKNLVENILDNCDGAESKNPKKAVIGITLYAAAMGVRVDAESGDVIRYEVVEVYEITDTCIIPDKIQLGDRVLYTVVDGVRLDADRVHKVVDHLLRARVGSELIIGIERDGEVSEITITLTEESFVTIK